MASLTKLQAVALKLPGRALAWLAALALACVLVAPAHAQAVTHYTNTTVSATNGINDTSCAGATTAEDDNNTGTDETDPYGAAISGTTLAATASSITAGGSFALKFRGTVN